ncbi:MAG TPA: hypothetical protein VIH57_18290, partial [Bacteroidales bacterium]
MKKVTVAVLLGFFLVSGCAKETDSPFIGHMIDIKYPTTYHTMPNTVVDSLKKEYLRDKNSCFQSSVNAFGFCASPVQYDTNCISECRLFNKATARRMVMEFLQKNKKFTGINDTSQVGVMSYYAFGKDYYCTSDSSRWKITIGNQVMDSLEVQGTNIYLQLNYTGVTEIIGNWYPVINIPRMEAISYEMAKSSLSGKQFDFMCWTNIHTTISQNTRWDEPLKRKLIYPLSKEDTIELHVVWVLKSGIFTFYV